MSPGLSTPNKPRRMGPLRQGWDFRGTDSIDPSLYDSRQQLCVHLTADTHTPHRDTGTHTPITKVQQRNRKQVCMTPSKENIDDTRVCHFGPV